jgi:CheY-like chemotaxis protein
MIEKILLAEDNAMNLKLALYGLRDYKVDIAGNGQEAIDLFSRNHYDMVIMDIKMPVVDGITASREIRKIEVQKQRKPGAVILGMTAGWVPDMIEECKKAGFNGFLPKPFRPKELPGLITGLYSKYIRELSKVSLPEE